MDWNVRTPPWTAILAALLLAPQVVADNVVIDTSALPSNSEWVPGTTYQVPMTYYLDCAGIGSEYTEGQEVVLSIANRDQFPWLNASTHPVTISSAECRAAGGSDEPVEPGAYIVYDADLNLVATWPAPAFTKYRLQPGADGLTNEGGRIVTEVQYLPKFVAPTNLHFDVEDAPFLTTIPLRMQANAASIFEFDVQSVLVDGVDRTDDNVVQINSLHHVDNVSTTSPNDVATAAGMRFDDLLIGEWSRVDAEMTVRLFAHELPDYSSEPQTIRLSFENAMPTPDESTDDDASNAAPGALVVPLLVALGLMGRRR